MLQPSIRILNWFKKTNRSFPWRHAITPYKILVAEKMLQRTKADQVLPIYIKFLKRFPSLDNLSHAKVSHVSKYIQPLGLHWRAKQFVDSALYIVKKYHGKFPETWHELTRIPGIGTYVAGAIMAVCYNNAPYVIDSNIARFINRFYGLNSSGEIRRKSNVIAYGKKLFRVKDQKKFLFALLDFTALVCRPRNPKCDLCVLNHTCCYVVKA